MQGTNPIESLQAHLGAAGGSVPDRRNKVTSVIERVVVFSLVEGLAFHLQTMQHP